MNEYIREIGCFMVLAAFVQMLSQGKFSRDISFILGIMLLILICSPINAFLKKGIHIKSAAVQNSTVSYEEMHHKLIADGIKFNTENLIVKETGAERAIVELNDDYSVKNVKIYGSNDSAAAAEICGIDERRVEIIK